VRHPYRDALTASRGYNPTRTVQVEVVRQCNAAFPVKMVTRAGAFIEEHASTALLFSP
jgi:hypothetical protein